MASEFDQSGLQRQKIRVRAGSAQCSLTEVLLSLASEGARRIVIVNSAIDNISFLSEAAREVIAAVPDARIMVVNWWDVVGEDFRNTLARDTGVARSDDHHAGMVESSLVMHIAPETTRPELVTGPRWQVHLDLRKGLQSEALWGFNSGSAEKIQRSGRVDPADHGQSYRGCLSSSPDIGRGPPLRCGPTRHTDHKVAVCRTFARSTPRSRPPGRLPHTDRMAARAQWNSKSSSRRIHLASRRLLLAPCCTSSKKSRRGRDNADARAPSGDTHSPTMHSAHPHCYCSKAYGRLPTYETTHCGATPLVWGRPGGRISSRRVAVRGG
ncbi:creatininase family protein [Nocardia sp. NBC_01009]|uniref:creatininase family protein n=1 Tax=Nocardia sp. NBC_01009 TaxID=2975996 RepID=UPI003868500B